MNLVWVAPAALGLLGLALLPILAHFIKKKPKLRLPFGAMMLLQKLPREMRKRRRLDDIVLLILRILCVVCMMLAISRPEIRYPSAESDLQRARAVVVIVDNSMSMDQSLSEKGASNRWTALSQAKKDAIAFVKGLPEDVSMGVVNTGGEATALNGEMVNEKALIENAILDIQQTHEQTDLSGAFRLARQMLEGKGGEVFVFTDEGGPNTVEDTRDEIALMSGQKVAMSPQIIRSEPLRNISVTKASYGEGPEGGVVRFTSMNFGEENTEAPCTAHLPGDVEITAFAEMDAGAAADTFVTVPRVSQGGVGRISVADDGVSLDNDFYFHLPRIGASRVLVIDGAPGATAINSEVYFLERALAPYGGRNDMVPDVIGSSGIGILDPEAHRVVFMANVGDPASVAAPLIEFVRNGGGLVVSLGGNVSADRYNTAFSDLLPAKLKRIENLAPVRQAAKPTATPDIALELFKPFARGGLKSFSKVEWTRMFSLDDFNKDNDVKVLLSLQNGQPLLLEKKIGEGRVLLLTSTIDTAWGTLPIQSAFMPLIQRMVSYLGGAASLGGIRVNGIVGETVKIPIPEGASDLILTGPKGPVGVQLINGNALFTPRLPGAYKLFSPGAPPLAWAAINTDPFESDIRPGANLLETAAEVDPERFLKKAALSPWLVLVALLVALLQSVLFRFRRENDKA